MRKLLFISIACVLSICVNAQIKINEPEYIGSIVFVNDSIGDGIPLERQTSSMQTKANGASYVPVVGLFAGKARSKSIVKGCCSPVIIKQKSNLHFIVHVNDNSIDPATIINIFPLKRNKDTREVELASASTLGGAKSGDIAFISFFGKKYGKSSYVIEISSLESGEYALTLKDRRDIFLMFQVE